MTKSVQVYHYDAFSTEANKGNPAGIVLCGDDLKVEEMQAIALKVGFNETAFPLKSNKADLSIRFFTPGHEMNLCGHATIATLYALKTKGLLQNKTDFTIETNAGVLPIKIDNANGDVYITMQQSSPQFKTFSGSKTDLANALGIETSDFDDNLPIVYGSTGVWTLLTPIKNLEVCEKLNPNNELFPSILKEMPHVSIHPFCMETYHFNTDMHARHFSSPFSGTKEDPVTGTASGVMGAYYIKYIEQRQRITNPFTLLIEQGQEIEKDGKVNVEVISHTDGYDIKISGNAVYVKTFHIALDDI
ncbi:phenazine biosynthesis, PhzF family protein [Staphylococcus xylosus]|uniref:PhzF family phenazine biosynthesis isomerase n=1 Tax=Staphylococcus xylosus TaxID=1288 RepID=UPI00085C3DE8|nr:PhzF family phenazine biosynthesis isomerase [Staphylococcus xylosus]SCU13849.1 phenazine biosynthesis, PhzF family protein [Staphylococcus xylosus]